MHSKNRGRAHVMIRYLWLGRILDGVAADRRRTRLSRYDGAEQAEDDYFRFANRSR